MVLFAPSNEVIAASWRVGAGAVCFLVTISVLLFAGVEIFRKRQPDHHYHTA
jgi:hypothetical protein